MLSSEIRVIPDKLIVQFLLFVFLTEKCIRLKRLVRREPHFIFNSEYENKTTL